MDLIAVIGDDKALAKRTAADRAYRLALQLHKRGQPEEAEAWFRQAAKAGHRHAAIRLGQLLEDQGKAEEAESWYRRAERAEFGDAAGAP
jgi:TPR repeat protein